MDEPPTARRVVFLDRDGTINVDRGYVCHYADWELIPGALEGLRQLHEAGYLLIVASNQSGISRGYCTAADVDRLHQQVALQLLGHRIPIAAIVYCPHTASAGCDCRKPRTALAQYASQRLGVSVDYPVSWTIGDKPTDAEFGRRLGTKTVLLSSSYWNSQDISGNSPVFSSLAAAAEYIVSLP